MKHRLPTKRRMNVYFSADLIAKVDDLALRRKLSKSAVIEAAVASFLSADASERLEAALSRRLDRVSRQIDAVDEDIAIVGEALSLFIRFWLSITPPLPDNVQASSKAKGTERFDGFMRVLGRHLASGDRFVREFSREVSPKTNGNDEAKGDS